MNNLVVTDVPGEVFLKDTISEGIAELVDDSIQARLGSIGLPTTVENANEVITDFCNFVAMEMNSRDAIFGGDSGVRVAPILVALDGSIHESLDFTHVVLVEVKNREGEGCSGSEASSTGSTLKFAAEFVEHEVSAVVVFEHGAVNSTVECLSESGELLSGESDGDHGWLSVDVLIIGHGGGLTTTLVQLVQLAHESQSDDARNLQVDPAVPQHKDLQHVHADAPYPWQSCIWGTQHT